MESICQLCDAHMCSPSNFQIGGNKTDGRIYDILKDIAPTFNDAMFFCKWRNDFLNCTELFKPTLTEEGYCYTFNNLNTKDIYTDE